jgi:hypothetical protein
MIRANYDCIIVGGGISGLYVARELLRSHPTWSLAIAEKYKGFGGRTYSYHPPGHSGVVWEMGAGRIRNDHVLLRKLIKEYGLTWFPIGNKTYYNVQGEDANLFEQSIVPIYFAPLASLGKSVLAKHTIRELLEQSIGKKETDRILLTFPYRGEVDTLRADIALNGFLGGGEMSSHDGYGVIAEGFSALVDALKGEIESRGGMLLPRHTLLSIEKGAMGTVKEGIGYDLDFFYGSKKFRDEPSGKIRLRANKHVVLALHVNALRGITNFYDWKMYKYLTMKPLLRIYMIFPTPAWFTGMARLITDQRPRYILPIDEEKGVIMISYTDSQDTEYYMKHRTHGGEKALVNAVMGDIRKLFDMEIPDPVFVRDHYWEDGVSYWRPGDYDPIVKSREALQPLAGFPGVHLCGESFSMRQAWVEGALEHATQCLESISRYTVV